MVPGNFTLLWSTQILLLIKPNLSNFDFVFIHSDKVGDIVAIWDFVCDWQLSSQLWGCKTTRPNRLACSPHLGWWKSLVIVSKRALNIRALWNILVHFPSIPWYFFFHTPKNTLVHKLQGPLADKWFILKTLNIVRRKQFLLFPQLRIWTYSRHFSLNQAQASPSGVLANWWDLLPHKNLITLPKQRAGFILKVYEQLSHIFSNLFENLRFFFSLPHLWKVVENVFSHSFQH